MCLSGETSRNRSLVVFLVSFSASLFSTQTTHSPLLRSRHVVGCCVAIAIESTTGCIPSPLYSCRRLSLLLLLLSLLCRRLCVLRTQNVRVVVVLRLCDLPNARCISTGTTSPRIFRLFLIFLSVPPNSSDAAGEGEKKNRHHTSIIYLFDLKIGGGGAIFQGYIL